MNVPIHIQVWHSKMVYIYSLCIQWCCIMMTTYILVMHISHESKKKGGGPLHILHIMRGGRRNFFSPKILGLPPFFTWLPLYIYIHKGWLGCAPTYFIYLMKVVPWRLIHIFSHLMKVVQWRLIHIFHISWRWCNGGSYILFHISWRWCSGWGIHIFFFLHFMRGSGLPDWSIHTFLHFMRGSGLLDWSIHVFFFYISWGGAGLPDWSIHIFLHFMRGCRIAGLEHTYFFLHFMRRDQKWRWRQKWRRRQVKENGSPYSSAVSIHRLPCRIDAFISLFV